MITQLIRETRSLVYGFPDEPMYFVPNYIYATHYKGHITTGATAYESIKNMLELIYK